MLCDDPSEATFFLTRMGEPFSETGMSALVRAYVDRAEIGKTGSCHLFRHAMATLMHHNGASVRHIQAILGHVKLETTQIYTEVSIRKLKEVHNATHPAKASRESGDGRWEKQGGRPEDGGKSDSSDAVGPAPGQCFFQNAHFKDPSKGI